MRASVLLVLLLLAAPASAQGQDRRSPRSAERPRSSARAREGARQPTQSDPLAAIADADPMELARVVDRLGDDAVLSRLEAARPREVRLAAMRASPFMAWPELALEPLARIAASRDPLLAPAATSAALTIARSLDPDALRRREVDPASLSAARGLFAALSTEARARADLRAAASMITALLDQIRG